MSEKKYAIRYSFDREMKEGGYTKQEILAEGQNKYGACDAFVFISILRNGPAHTTGLDTAIMSVDGYNKGEPIPNTELFSCFAHLAHSLMSFRDIPSWQRKICQEVFESVRRVVTERETT